MDFDQDYMANCSTCSQGKTCLQHLKITQSLSFYIDQSLQTRSFVEIENQNCEIHDKPCIYWCKNDKKEICFKCIGEHPDCDTDEIEMVFIGLQEQLNEQLNQAEEGQKEEEVIQEQQSKEIKRQFNEQETNLRLQLQKIQEEINTLIREIFRRQMKEMLQAKQKALQEIQSQILNLKQQTLELSQLKKLKYENIREILSIIDQVEKQKVNKQKQQQIQEELEVKQISEQYLRQKIVKEIAQQDQKEKEKGIQNRGSEKEQKQQAKILEQSRNSEVNNQKFQFKKEQKSCLDYQEFNEKSDQKQKFVQSQKNILKLSDQIKDVKQDLRLGQNIPSNYTTYQSFASQVQDKGDKNQINFKQEGRSYYKQEAE